MKLPRPRFTVRRLMVAVAIVASGFWAERMWRQRQDYLDRAIREGVGEKHYAYLARVLETGTPTLASFRGSLPDGSRVHIFGFGSERRVFFKEYGGGNPFIDDQSAADEVAVAGWAVMCRSESLRIRQLRLKYEWAARYPWLPVAPDPPAPKPKPK
jgi:hypothetical protein